MQDKNPASILVWAVVVLVALIGSVAGLFVGQAVAMTMVVSTAVLVPAMMIVGAVGGFALAFVVARVVRVRS
jgi:hypothetical protein